MKIYTRTGDKGSTALFGGTRVSKDDVRVEAYGSVDELNSFVGFLICEVRESGVRDHLTRVQNELFILGAHLAADPEKPALKLPPVSEDMVERLEREIDRMEENLEPLKNFLLPGGSESVSRAHICRTVCRRAERRVVAKASMDKVHDIILRYLNRLSDYFFVLSRHLAKADGVTDVAWVPDEKK